MYCFRQPSRVQLALPATRGPRPQPQPPALPLLLRHLHCSRRRRRQSLPQSQGGLPRRKQTQQTCSGFGSAASQLAAATHRQHSALHRGPGARLPARRRRWRRRRQRPPSCRVRSVCLEQRIQIQKAILVPLPTLSNPPQACYHPHPAPRPQTPRELRPPPPLPPGNLARHSLRCSGAPSVVLRGAPGPRLRDGRL